MCLLPPAADRCRWNLDSKLPAPVCFAGARASGHGSCSDCSDTGDGGAAGAQEQQQGPSAAAGQGSGSSGSNGGGGGGGGDEGGAAPGTACGDDDGAAGLLGFIRRALREQDGQLLLVCSAEKAGAAR